MTTQRASREDTFIDGRDGPWEVIVGLEVHAQVSSDAKLFSGAPTAFGAEENSQVSLIDAAMPGMLPVVNEACIAQAVRTGLGLNAKINTKSIFARKNYFYPDLPQGYQISQFDRPIVGEGEVVLDMASDLPDAAKTSEHAPDEVRIGIERLHLEQDAGKSIHDQRPDVSLVDLNRSGVALMEIVSKPDLRSAAEAKAFVAKLRAILRTLGTCDGNMEQGSLRADVNVSVRRPGDAFGTRCEIKNVNSIRFIGEAIDAEAARQIAVLEEGGVIDQETRLYDPNSGETRAMRSKEEAHDYRYFPCPDLLPITFTDAFVSELAAALPELPDARKARFVEAYGLTAYDAGVLVADPAAADYFEAVAAGRDAKAAANWVTGELFGALNRRDLAMSDSPVTAAALGALLDLISDGTLSTRLARDVFDAMVETGRPPAEIVEEKGLKQVSDTGELEAIVDQLMADNPKQVDAVRNKPKAVGWFVGQVMQRTGGQANPAIVNQILKAKLGI
ncbi:MAG: Asp-tRNA(Asn)/Glu-tRNA(Gln) amidotransferase subunit GatB [Pseudomonadota bacterium]